MPENSLQKLYVEQLKDLYSAENQLVKALPKMAKAAKSEELREGFEQHLQQTKGHVQRLEQILGAMDQSPKGRKCAGMQGLVQEGEEVIEENSDGNALDAGLIAAAQRVEHYEIAGYGSVRTFAELLGESEAVNLLQQTLDEEKETDEKLTEIAKEVNSEAMSGDTEIQGSEDAEEAEEPESRHRTKRAAKARSARA
jgi:ferritin-like metal-binding protein YciE